MHTNPILPCVSSARRPQGKKRIPYLTERWEPVFQVILFAELSWTPLQPRWEVEQPSLPAGTPAAEFPAAPVHAEDILQHSQPWEDTSAAGKGRARAGSPKARPAKRQRQQLC